MDQLNSNPPMSVVDLLDFRKATFQLNPFNATAL
jgi:hypothetical protein